MSKIAILNKIHPEQTTSKLTKTLTVAKSTLQFWFISAGTTNKNTEIQYWDT